MDEAKIARSGSPQRPYGKDKLYTKVDQRPVFSGKTKPVILKIAGR